MHNYWTGRVSKRKQRTDTHSQKSIHILRIGDGDEDKDDDDDDEEDDDTH